MPAPAAPVPEGMEAMGTPLAKNCTSPAAPLASMPSATSGTADPAANDLPSRSESNTLTGGLPPLTTWMGIPEVNAAPVMSVAVALST